MARVTMALLNNIRRVILIRKNLGGFMKKLFSLVAGLVLATSLQAAEWSTYEGCYTTLEFDGAPVTNPGGVQSRADDGPSIFYSDLSGADIPSVNFYLFQEYQDGEWRFFYLPIFLDRGTRTSLADGATASFVGDVIMSLQNNEIWHMDVAGKITEKDVVRRLVEFNGTITTPSRTYAGSASTLIEQAPCQSQQPKVPMFLNPLITR
jgi:hypothetical protein